jgi:hypothetical protein
MKITRKDKIRLYGPSNKFLVRTRITLSIIIT